MRHEWSLVMVAMLASGCMKETTKVRTRAAAAAESVPARGDAVTRPVSTRHSGAPRHGLLESASGQPEELGAAEFGRDLKQGLAESRATGRPVFLLFTEVPGCHTVKSFGNGPLRHPLIVEAIEDAFVPVAIYNNKGGADREVLESFGEPAWNNPVVRFVDAEREDLADRYATGWTVGGLATAMVAALDSAGRDVPGYLRSLARETTAARKTTVFSMYCFWSGEVGLAGLDGVVSTRPGFAAGREAVEVTWDARQTTLSRLLKDAKRSGAASGVVARGDGERGVAEQVFDEVAVDDDFRYSAKDDKYQIRRTKWARVPMTAGQASRVNRAAATSGESPRDVLSPRQLRLARSDARWDSRSFRPDFRPVTRP
jgi:hypothetical protein